MATFDPTEDIAADKSKRTSKPVFDPTEDIATAAQRQYGRQGEYTPEPPVYEQTSKVGGFVRDLVSPKREHDYPEIYSIVNEPNVPLAAGLLTASTAEQERDIVLQNIPGAQVYQDAYGNDIVELPTGERAYINRPGLSRRDITKAAAQIPLYIGAGRVVGALAGGAGVPARIAAGLSQGGVQAGLDVATQQAGAKDGVDAGRVALAAGSGVLGELVGGPLVADPVYRATRKQATLADAVAQLRARGATDSDIAAMGDDALEAVRRQINVVDDPAMLARREQARNLPVPVPLTAGQASGNVRQQLFEDAVRKGVYGETAQQMLESTKRQADEALRANVNQGIPARLSGGAQTVTAKGGASPIISDALNMGRAEAKKAVSDAYDQAIALKAGVAPADAQGILGNVLADAQKWGFTPADFPDVGKKAIDSLRQITRNGADLAQLQQWRKTLNSRIQSAAASGGDEYSALLTIKKSFDDALDGVQVQGDQAAKDAWKTARQLRKQFGDDYEADDIVARLTTKSQKKRGALAVAPEDATNELFGQGFNFEKKGLERDLLKLKKMLNEKDWNSLREDVFLRLARKSEGAFEGGERQFSGVGLAKELDNMSRSANGKRILNIMYSQQEQALIRQLSAAAARATNTAKNTSNTAVMQRLFNLPFVNDKLRPVLAAIPLAKTVYGPAAAGGAIRATVGGKQLPAGISGGLAAGGVANVFGGPSRERTLQKDKM